MPLLVDRRRLLERVRRAGAPLIALVAPAGYGKSYIAARIAREDPRWGIVDAAGAADPRSFVRALAALPALGGDASRGFDDVVAAWSGSQEPISLILDNLERLEDAESLTYVSRLLRARPPHGKTILCARRELRLRLSDVAAPHLLVTVRGDELRFDEREMAQLFDDAAVDDTTLYRAMRLTEGWPVPALYLQRIVHEGGFDLNAETLPEPLFADLFDYLEAQVFAEVGPPIFAALVAAAGWSDVTESELERHFDGGGESVVAALTRIHQLARPVDADRLEIHPLVRRAVAQRHRREFVQRMRTMAEAFEADKRWGRAAECWLLADDVDAAGACARSAEGFIAMGSLPPDAIGGDPVALAAYPELWLAGAAARRVVEKPAVLAHEALAVLESLDRKTGDSVHDAVVALTALCLADAGRVAEAGAVLDRARGGLAEEPPTSGAFGVAAARVSLAAHAGAYGDAVAGVRRLRPRVRSDAALWFPPVALVEMQAARARGQWEIEHDVIERLVAVGRRERAPSLLGVALAEATFGSWLVGDDELFAAYRAQLAELLEQQDLAGLVSFNVAALGRAPARGRTRLPLWDARAFLVAAVDAPVDAAAEYAQAAVGLADASGEALTRILARVASSEKVAAARDRRLAEALALGTAIDAPALLDSLAALGRGDVRGPLATFVNRLRRRSGTVAEAAAGASLSIRLADGTVRRDADRIDVSEGGLALLAALAIAPRPVAREVLVDRLWPDLGAESAYNALKMCVHRTRAQLGDPRAIVVARTGYALAPEVDVDLPRIERAVQDFSRGGREPALIAELQAAFAALSAGRPGAFAQWDWFAAVEQRLDVLTREAGGLLGRHALERGDHVAALTIAQRLVKLDPLDEGARQLAIATHLAADDRGSAILEYRQYRELLRKELDVEPSFALKRLLEAS